MPSDGPFPIKKVAETLKAATEKGLVGWQKQGDELFSTQFANVTVMVGRAIAGGDVPFAVSVFDDKNQRVAGIDDRDAGVKSVVDELYARAGIFVRDANKAGADKAQPALITLDAMNQAIAKA